MFLISISVTAAKIKNKNIIRKIFYKKFYGHDFTKKDSILRETVFYYSVLYQKDFLFVPDFEKLKENVA